MSMLKYQQSNQQGFKIHIEYQSVQSTLSSFSGTAKAIAPKSKFHLSISRPRMADKRFGFSPGSVLPHKGTEEQTASCVRYEGVLCLNPSRPLGQAKACLGPYLSSSCSRAETELLTELLNFWKSLLSPNTSGLPGGWGESDPKINWGSGSEKQKPFLFCCPHSPSLIRSSPSCSLHLTCPSLPACHDWVLRRDESGPGSAQGAGKGGARSLALTLPHLPIDPCLQQLDRWLGGGTQWSENQHWSFFLLPQLSLADISALCPRLT